MTRPARVRSSSTVKDSSRLNGPGFLARLPVLSSVRINPHRSLTEPHHRSIVALMLPSSGCYRCIARKMPAPARYRAHGQAVKDRFRRKRRYSRRRDLRAGFVGSISCRLSVEVLVRLLRALADECGLGLSPSLPNNLGAPFSFSRMCCLVSCATIKCALIIADLHFAVLLSK
jgi:hypothetical protein